MSATVFWKLWPDLRFWRASATPQELDAGHATEEGEDVHVAITAPPDRSLALRLRGRHHTGRRLVPVLGTQRRLWLEVEGEAAGADPRHDERHQGRLRRLDALDYQDELVATLAALPPHPHFLPRAAYGTAGTVTDVHGDRVTITDTTPVEAEEQVPGVAHVTVLATDTILDAAGARTALGALGLSLTPLPVTDERAFPFEVAGEPDDVKRRLAELRLFAVIVEPKLVRHAAPAAQVKAEGDALRVGTARLAPSSILRVAVLVPETLPADARVVLVGEAPAAYWYVPLLYGVLGVLCLVMIWAYARTLRPERAAAPSAGGPEGAASPL